MTLEDGEIDQASDSSGPIDEHATDAFPGGGDEDVVLGRRVLLSVGMGAELELRFEYGLDLLLVQTGNDEDSCPLFHEEAEQQGLIEVGGRLESNGLWQVRGH